MNFLTEHKIEQYADLVSRIEDMAAESGQAADALKDAEKRLADMAVFMMWKRIPVGRRRQGLLRGTW